MCSCHGVAETLIKVALMTNQSNQTNQLFNAQIHTFLPLCQINIQICHESYCSRADDFTPGLLGGVRVATTFLYFNVLCCSIMCLYVLSCVLLFQLPFPHKNDFQFVFTSSCLYESSCLIYVICVCLRILVSNTYVVLCFCFVLSCVPCVASFSRL